MMRVLSFDGGGIRGLLSARLLWRLSVDHPVVEKADVLAGTSTGGIIALALAAGLTPSDVTAWYMKQGPEIFNESLARRFNELLGAKYPSGPLASALGKVLPPQLSYLKKRVIVPAFRLDGSRWTPYVFDTADPANAGLDPVGIALATSAAPTYFGTACYNGMGFCDGGVWANDPTMEAVTMLGDYLRAKALTVLSIGTGLTPQSMPEAAQRSLDWGAIEWVRPLLGILLEGPQEAASVQAARLLGPQAYYRLNPEIPAIGLDDARDDTLGALIKWADAFDLTVARLFLDQAGWVTATTSP